METGLGVLQALDGQLGVGERAHALVEVWVLKALGVLGRELDDGCFVDPHEHATRLAAPDHGAADGRQLIEVAVNCRKKLSILSPDRAGTRTVPQSG